MKNFKRLIASAIVLTMAAILLAACNNSGRTITVYTALENELIDRYLQLFNEQHPEIRVNIVRDSTGVITARLLAEGENTSADLVWGLAATSLLVLEERGLLEAYAPVGLENILPQFRDSANPPAWVGITAWELAIVKNTVLAEQMNLPPITSYHDLLRPEFSGQIVMSNPASSGTGFLAVSGLIQLWGEEQAFEFLDALHENIAMYSHSGSAPARMAATGEFAVGISFGYAGVSNLNRGYPVEVIFPVEGSGWDVEANALIRREAINPDAQLFLDWAISQEVMELMADDYAITSIPVRDEIPAGYSQNPIEQLLPNDFRWAAQNRERILQEWSRRYE